MEEAKLRLVTQEGERVLADVRLKDVSGIIKNLVEDAGVNEEIPLPQVSKAVLQKIIEYYDRQSYLEPQLIKKPIPSDNIVDAVNTPWHAEFISGMEEELLIELTIAANFMDMKGLFDLCCAKIASMFKGKTVEELKQRYHIEEDLTPEEEEKIKKEHPWVMSDDSR